VEEQEPEPGSRSSGFVLRGTTLAVYRFMFRNRDPVGAHDIQNGLKMSSASVAQYHLEKLLESGLIREEAGKYVVNASVFENMVRIRRVAIPFHTSYLIFFLGTIIVLLTVLRPPSLTNTYYFALLALFVALGASALDVARALREF
jgi:hypothetical protein